MHWLVVSFLLCLPNCCHLSEPNYYWRNYFGTIPSDAVSAGTNLVGDNVYIGQGYVRNGGIEVGQINIGEEDVYAPFFDAYLMKFVKILCGPQQNFFWVNVNSTNVYELLKDKPAVIGGHDDFLAPMRVGRINVGGNTIVGKSVPWANATYNNFHYLKDGKEIALQGSYQVLIYRDFKEVVEVL